MRSQIQLAAVAVGLLVAAPAHAITLTVGDAATPTLSDAANFANQDANPNTTYDILIPAGTYINSFANVTRPMTIEALGGSVTLKYDSLGGTVPLQGDKGIITTTSSLTVKGITFQGAQIADGLGGNGAGIRDQSTGATTLRVEGSSFIGNQDGILTAGSGNQETVQIINSQFLDNGSGTGQTHALYVGDALSLLVQNSTFCGTLEGHDIKSRAMSTTVQGSKVFDGATGPGCANAGTTSYGIEFPNGGTAQILDTEITQGGATHNSTMVSYGAEGLPYANNSLFVGNTSFVSSGVNAVGIQALNTTSGCQLSNPTFSGVNTEFTPPTFCTTSTTPPDGPVAVPEPQSLWLLLTAALGFGAAFFARTAVRL
jgi:hypothetical protein